MLTSLRIKNLALVADLTLELQPGYNVITGETGAGKSILIGALNLVLGERADRTAIRGGADSCSVEAVFDVRHLNAPLKTFLEQNGLEPCEDHQLVLKRTFAASGTNRQFVNGSATTLGTLAAIGEWLVDIHGPHDHQSLLHPAKQLELLDAYGGLQADREAFSALVQRRAAMEKEKSGLIVDEKTYAQQLDLLRFQVSEIQSAKLDPAADAEIESSYQRASNSARLLQLGQSALGILSDDDASLLTQAGALGRTLQELRRLDPAAAGLLEQQEQTAAALRELQSDLSHYLDTVDLDPQTLQQLEDRLNVLQSLRRKYGHSIEEIQAFGDQAARQLQSLEQRDEELARINAALARLDADLLESGRSLTAKRRKVIPRLSKAVSRQLQDLGFKQSRLDAALTPVSKDTTPNGALAANPSSPGKNAAPEWRLTGMDQVEFQFAPNPGEPARPLRAIASSGELARVMLALKTVLAAEDAIPVLVFDEVDANVGGETANAVGEKMRQIAAARQVLCITHLPQVAASASAHFVVSKETKDGRTLSAIRMLDRKARVEELTRMLGGSTAAARKHAEALLE